MSTDAFSPVLFPRLDGRADGAEHARARMRGYAEGHAEGYRAGRAEAEAEQRVAAAEQAARDAAAAREMETAVSALHAAARSLGDRERELSAAAHDEVLRCAIELAELIVGAELSDAGSSAAAAARRVLAAAEPAEIREVRLHPDDLRTLQTADAQLTAFALVADDTLERGDAVATLAHGHIDARIGSALERARRALVEAGS
ncbi:FliH/SctL family protein [Microbacterium sp. A20]|uniref:FliH/SctL family protein n=2 Tax=unclassified Microbacterium TaxID=2609290 RepID=UPI00144452F3|nr:FliH/SctL family protein [Microbacterium sp. A20]